MHRLHYPSLQISWLQSIVCSPRQICKINKIIPTLKTSLWLIEFRSVYWVWQLQCFHCSQANDCNIKGCTTLRTDMTIDPLLIFWQFLLPIWKGFKNITYYMRLGRKTLKHIHISLQKAASTLISQIGDSFWQF